MSQETELKLEVHPQDLAALLKHPLLKARPTRRERLLNTANRTGIYANSEAYGRGLMDLEAASRL